MADPSLPFVGLVVAFLASAPINNTPIGMIMTPVAIMLARSRNLAPPDCPSRSPTPPSSAARRPS